MATQFDKKLILLEQERRQIRADLEKNVAAFRAEYQVRAHPPPASTPAPRRPDLGDVSSRLLSPRSPPVASRSPFRNSVHPDSSSPFESLPSRRSQKKEHRREYDLNDPNGVRASLPARLGDDDPRCGASGLQKFSGEDLRAGERRKAQLAQAAAWHEAQAAEKAAARRRAREEDVAHGELIKAQEAYQRDAAAAHASRIRERDRDYAADNATLAEKRAAAKAEEAALAAAAAEAEAEAVAADPWLAEDPSLGVSAAAPETRVRPDHWKGHSEAQRVAIRRARDAQLEERRATEAMRAAEEAAIANAAEGVRKTLEMRAEQVEAFKLEQRMAVRATVDAQRARKAALDATARSDRFARDTFRPEYFAQFGTSAR